MLASKLSGDALGATKAWPLWRYALPLAEVGCALAAGAIWTVTGGAVWYRETQIGAWPLLLLAALWPLHWLTVGLRLRPSTLDLMLALFLLSAGASVWAAYDRGPALAKFWLIVGAAGLYVALAHQPNAICLRNALAVLGLFGLGLAFYFAATNDWSAQAVKVPLLGALGRGISRWLPELEGHRINANVMGGMLASLVPYYVPLVRAGGRRGAEGAPTKGGRLRRLFWVIVAVGAILGCLMTASRGAWLALLGAGALWVAWRWIGRWASRRFSKDRAWRVRLLGMGILVAATALAGGIAAWLVTLLQWPGSAALANRVRLWRDAWILIRQYPFTGGGLGMFQMLYTLYALIIHVGYVPASHNLYLDLTIEQGIPGLGLFLALMAVGVTRGLVALRRADGRLVWFIEAALASLAIALIHGLVDDALYSSRGMLLLFVPLGVIAAAAQLAPQAQRRAASDTERDASRPRARPWIWVSIAVLVIGLPLAGVYRWPLLGSWYANLGALAQARVELNVYDQAHFDDPDIDTVRRQESLDVAIAYLSRALVYDPDNVTAHRRLAEIALARRDYDQALAHMELAWEGGHRDAATRLVLGDALVAAGEVERAVAVLRDLHWAKSRLQGQAWSRYEVHGDRQRTYYAWKAASLLDLTDMGLKQKVAEFEKQNPTSN
ncbi:MAG: tetratricopeptide repeat protein [Anaerolineae bacterium]|nr:tetratricopeptide repeat protein [Anaerolineae bacterium]